MPWSEAEKKKHIKKRMIDGKPHYSKETPRLPKDKRKKPPKPTPPKRVREIISVPAKLVERVPIPPPHERHSSIRSDIEMIPAIRRPGKGRGLHRGSHSRSGKVRQWSHDDIIRLNRERNESLSSLLAEFGVDL